jgi:hypothetical protein
MGGSRKGRRGEENRTNGTHVTYGTYRRGWQVCAFGAGGLREAG